MNLMANLVTNKRHDQYSLSSKELISALNPGLTEKFISSHNMVKISKERKKQIYDNIKIWGLTEYFTIK